MLDPDALICHEEPYRHWLGVAVSHETVASINAEWPESSDERWVHEQGRFSRKSAMQFPRRLPDAAQCLAEVAYSSASCLKLSAMTGIALEPDPWFLEGPMRPLLGGGLHEIHPGGLLKMHIDFNRHPSGLVRCLNLLIYLNLDWKPEWGGALELAEKKSVLPTCGMTVVFETTPDSWHGHPHALACPVGVTRRSLALYYYTRSSVADRDTTVYKK